MGYVLLHSGQPSAKRLLKRVSTLSSAESIDQTFAGDTLIRWGNVTDSDDGRLVINSKKAIETAQSKNQMKIVLRENGVRFLDFVQSNKSTIQISRMYRVLVFNMKALTCHRTLEKSVWLNRRMPQMVDRFERVQSGEDQFYDRITRLALRAVHALGLDFGYVDIGVTPRGILYVLDMSATPVLKGEWLNVFGQAIENWIHDEDSNEYQGSFRMGADLEFMIRNQDGQMVLASKFLPRKGVVGCDARSINRDRKRYPLAEVRPQPAYSPEELFENIKDALFLVRKNIPRSDFQWVAGSMPFEGYWIGGHIHFSDIALSSRLVRAFDNYLALPIMLIENQITAIKRRPRYGFLGDIRIKPHGGFEYRTLGSWLVSPEISRAVLALSYVVASQYKKLHMNPLSDVDIQTAFYKGNKRVIRKVFDQLWSDIQSTERFPKYARDLEIIPTMIRDGDSWQEDVDIKTTWAIQAPSKRIVPNRTRHPKSSRAVSASQLSVPRMGYWNYENTSPNNAVTMYQTHMEESR